MLVEEIPPNTTQFSLRRFDRYTRYKFSLAAQTQVGVGETFTEESPHFTTEGKKKNKTCSAFQKRLSSVIRAARSGLSYFM